MVLSDFLEEHAGTFGLHLAPSEAAGGTEKAEFLSGTGHGHVADATLFLEVLVGALVNAAGEDLVLHSHDEDTVVLESLCVVHGDQGDAFLALALFLSEGRGIQRCQLQEVVDSLLPLRELLQGEHVHELLDVFGALVFLEFLGAVALHIVIENAEMNQDFLEELAVVHGTEKLRADVIGFQEAVHPGDGSALDQALGNGFAGGCNHISA